MRNKIIILVVFLIVCFNAHAGVEFDDGNYTTGSYIDCGNDASLQIAEDLSISLWMKPDDLTTASQAVFTKTGLYEAAAMYLLSSYGIGLHNAVVYLDLYTTQTGYGAKNCVTITLSDTNWHHIVMTFDASEKELKGYLDGTLSDTVATTYGTIADPDRYNLFIGRNGRNHASIPNFAGMENEIAIWNAVLTQAEVTNLYSRVKGMPLQIRPANLQGYWALDDGADGTSGTDVTYKDMSGTGNDGTGHNTLTNKAEEILSYPE